jgi:hypothetical protein
LSLNSVPDFVPTQRCYAALTIPSGFIGKRRNSLKTSSG